MDFFAEETFADLGKKRKNRKTFFCKHVFPLKYFFPYTL